MKRFIVGALATVALATGAVAAATGAAASTTATCDSDSIVPLTVTAGSTSTFTIVTASSTLCNKVYAIDHQNLSIPTHGTVSYTDGSGSTTVPAGGFTQNAVNGLVSVTYVAPNMPGSDAFYVGYLMGNTFTYSDFQITVLAAPSANNETGSGSGPILQALPLPNSGTCDDIQDSAFAWGTGLSGGWKRSWQPWAGALETHGGWACSRTLVMDSNQVWSIGD